VDRDDGLEARVLVVAEDDLLVAGGVEGFEDHQRGSAPAPTIALRAFRPTGLVKSLNRQETRGVPAANWPGTEAGF
jgi:hypothetical protein